MGAIHDFVLRGGQRLTAGGISDFLVKIPFVKAKAETLDTADFPHLRGQAGFLARYVEDTLEGVFPCGDLSAAAEAVFALGYLLRDVDIIPDDISGAGLADDSAVLRAVISSHRTEFDTFAEFSKIGRVSEDP